MRSGRNGTFSLPVVGVAGILVLSACGGSSEPDAGVFTQEAEKLGYRCVETEPYESITLMWTCVDDDDQEMVLKNLSSEDSRKNSQGSIPEGQTVLVGETWYLAGDDQGEVTRIGELLGGM